MDDFNPYRPPASCLAVEKAPRERGLGVFYRVLNLLYAGLLILATLIQVSNHPQSLQDSRAPLTLLILYAPVLCFLLLCWGTPRLVRLGLGLQALLALWLVYVFVDNLVSGSLDLGVGSVMLGANLLALFGGLLQPNVKPLKEHA